MTDAPPPDSAEDETRDRGRLARHAKKIANYHVLLAGAMEDLEYPEEGARSESGTDEPEHASEATSHLSLDHAGPQKPLRVFDLPPEFRQQPSCYVPNCTARFDRYRPDLKPALWVRTCLSHSRPHITPGACSVCNDGPNPSVSAWTNDQVRVSLCTACSTRLEAQIRHFVRDPRCTVPYHFQSFRPVGSAPVKKPAPPTQGTQMVEEGGLTFTFADAPEKIEAVEKPPPPVRTKLHHSPPPLRALKSAPDSAPKRRRSSHTAKADDDDGEHSHRSAPSKNRVDATPDDPVRALQNYLQLVRKWETDGALAAGLAEFVVDRFYATQPSQALQAVLALAAADASVLPWVNSTLLRWRNAAAPPVQPNPEKLAQ